VTRWRPQASRTWALTPRAPTTVTGTTESHTIKPADRDILREADRVAASMAAEHSVRYDEWQVARDGTAGELRPTQ
jgi:hypothetical protein